jgi:tripartite-type tricarboxylate transporter receptor subunit TctC
MRAVHRALPVLALVACGATPVSVIAQAYPVKPVRWVVPFPPGGSADVNGRIIGLELAKRLGQQVVIDNRPGANGIVGSEHVARAAPDGYTLLQGNVGQMTTFPSLYAKLPYDPVKDFAPITVLQTTTTTVVVTPALPVKTVQELVALARRNPGALNYTASGAGSTTYLTGELLKRRAGIHMEFISYKGSGPALTDVMAGFVQVMFEAMPSALPLIRSGKLKVLAVTSKDRSPILPQVPTLHESGFPGFDMVSWQCLLAPAGTPQAVIDRLHAEVVQVLRSPEIAQKLTEQGGQVVANTPAEFARFIRDETAKWSRIIMDAGIRLDP